MTKMCDLIGHGLGHPVDDHDFFLISNAALLKVGQHYKVPKRAVPKLRTYNSETLGILNLQIIEASGFLAPVFEVSLLEV